MCMEAKTTGNEWVSVVEKPYSDRLYVNLKLPIERVQRNRRQRIDQTRLHIQNIRERMQVVSLWKCQHKMYECVKAWCLYFGIFVFS